MARLVQGLVQVVPSRIIFLDQADFPGPVPLLDPIDPTLAPEGRIPRLMRPAPNQDMDTISGGETSENLLPMLPDLVAMSSACPQ
jgi:hypothetical protein